MNVMKLMVVALAGWINQQQEDRIDYATAASGLIVEFQSLNAAFDHYSTKTSPAIALLTRAAPKCP